MSWYCLASNTNISTFGECAYDEHLCSFFDNFLASVPFQASGLDRERGKMIKWDCFVEKGELELKWNLFIMHVASMVIGFWMKIYRYIHV